MNECWSCKAKFKVKFDDEDQTTAFCPACGEEMFEEINISEGHFIVDDTGEEEWE